MDEITLNSLITCLTTQIESLHVRDHLWTACLIVGCFFEVIFVVHEYLGNRNNWYQAKIRGSIAFPERPSILWLMFEMLGVILVVAGIGGELHVNILAGRLETQLRVANGKLVALSNGKASEANERSVQLENSTQTLITDAANATRDMAKAQLELAKLTGPIQLVPVNDGIASPDPTKGMRLRVLLHRDTRIHLPALPKGKAISWTLFITQDSGGQHQFRSFPIDFSHGNVLWAPPNSSRICPLTTDFAGTTLDGIDCGYSDPPPSTPIGK